jgi:exoribonuclease R
VVQYFDEHIEDKTLIETNLQKGVFFRGVVKTNPRFRQRAFVSIPELNVDVLIKGFREMNRAMDGDTVIVELDSVQTWLELAD